MSCTARNRFDREVKQVYLRFDAMEKAKKKSMSLYMFLSFTFVIASISIVTVKLTSLPPEYTIVAATLLFGASGAAHCLNLQKKQEQLDALKASMESFKLTSHD